MVYFYFSESSRENTPTQRMKQTNLLANYLCKDTASSEPRSPHRCQSVCSSKGSEDMPTLHLIQPTVTELINKNKPFHALHPKVIKTTQLITEMIALDIQPFSAVEDRGFRQLINFLEPRYTIPGRKYFSNVAIPKLYETTKKSVCELLCTVEPNTMSFTTDMWSSTANDDYLSLTAHFITTDFELKHISLTVAPFNAGTHTGDNISKFLHDAFEEWNVSDKVYVIVRDNGRNFVSAMEKGKFEHIPCLAHSLQLIIKDGVFNNGDINDLFKTCRRLVGHYKHSVQANKILKKAQKVLGVPQHKLVQDEPTRWNSTLDMLERLLEQRRAITYSSQELNVPVELTNIQWSCIQKVVDILQIFNVATKAVSLETASVSEVIPIVNGIRKSLQKRTGKYDGIRNDMLASLNVRYGTCEKNPIYAISTILNPKFKKDIFVEKNLADRACDRIERMLKDEQVETDEGPPETVRNNHSPLWSLFEEVMKANSVEEEHDKTHKSVGNELSSYLQEPRINPSKDILQYWKESHFTSLKKIARKFLAIPPATVSSERMFSTSGLICDKKRSRLDPDKVQMLVFLNRNLQ